MIAVSVMENKCLALFGLADSGLASARALLAGGADVVCADDDTGRVRQAASEGLKTADLRNIDWRAFDALILAPGVPLTHPEPHWSVKAAQAAGVEIIGDIELFHRQRQFLNAQVPFIAITGTNGKSTTTALIGHILQEAGFDAQVGGNIGTPVLDLAPITEGRAYAIECSSYQIDLAPSLAPSIGIVLNVTPDHLQRHGTMSAYAAIKEEIAKRASGRAIVGVDDTYGREIVRRLAEKGAPFTRISGSALSEDGVYCHGSDIVVASAGHHEPWVSLEAIATLRGRHNGQNAAAAVATCRSLGLTRQVVQKALKSFPGLAHRMQPIAYRGDILFVNDSKATNSKAAAQALASYTNIYWIAGGLHKEGGYDDLVPFFPHITKAYLVGEAAAIMAAYLGAQVDYEICRTIDDAVNRAAREAQAASRAPAASGSPPVVLLSPACASFDQFRNFEERGEAFVRAVTCLADTTSLIRNVPNAQRVAPAH